MKVQVSPAIKGELLIKSMKASFKGGTNLNLTDAEYCDSATQSLVARGWLIPMEAATVSTTATIRLRSNKKSQIIFNVIGRAIGPFEVFHVSTEQFKNYQIQKALEKGLIIEEKATEIEDPHTDVNKQIAALVLADATLHGNKTDKQEVKAEEKIVASKTPAKSKTSTKNQKTSKTIKKAHILKPARSSEKKGDPNTPSGMKVYRPEGVEINEPPQKIESESDNIFIKLNKNEPEIDFIDANSQSPDIDFVDDQQLKERIRKRNIAGNNEEIA